MDCPYFGSGEGAMESRITSAVLRRRWIVRTPGRAPPQPLRLHSGPLHGQGVYNED